MRESCKSGSVGEAAGDRRLYPTVWFPRRGTGVDADRTLRIARVDIAARRKQAAKGGSLPSVAFGG